MKKIITSLFIGIMPCAMIQAQEYLRVGSEYIPVKDIISIEQSVKDYVDTSSLAYCIENNESSSVYAKALIATGINDSLRSYMDYSYKWAKNKDRVDSCTWTNDKLITGLDFDNVAYPERRYYNHTFFVVKDEVLQSKYGINKALGKDDTSSLEYLAHKLYDPVYPEDKNIHELTDRRNALNRFISYHILELYGTKYSLTAMDDNMLMNNFNRNSYDICDWYETLMPHSMMKVSFPGGTNGELYINRRGVQDREDERGVLVPGTKVGDIGQRVANGIYYYIDDVIAYDQNTQKVVFDDNIRIDCTTLSPDFMTKGSDGEIARGHSTISGHYSSGGQDRTCVGFKPGYCRNFEFDNNTRLYVSNRNLYYWDYEGDRVVFNGDNYNVKVKLPSVPAGTYELRMFMCVGLPDGDTVETYIDDTCTGSIDFTKTTQELFGYKTDAELGNEAAINAFDKKIHEMGWMKGPACYTPGNRSSFDTYAATFRDLSGTVRKVIGRVEFDGKTDHYLTIKKVGGSQGSFSFDFIELVPTSVCDNENVNESKM